MTNPNTSPTDISWTTVIVSVAINLGILLLILGLLFFFIYIKIKKLLDAKDKVEKGLKESFKTFENIASKPGDLSKDEAKKKVDEIMRDLKNTFAGKIPGNIPFSPSNENQNKNNKEEATSAKIPFQNKTKTPDNQTNPKLEEKNDKSSDKPKKDLPTKEK